MAVTLPSDIVLDVIRGADPARLKMAAAKFGAMPEAPPIKTAAFADVLNAEGSEAAPQSGQRLASLFSDAPESGVRGQAAEPHKAFERMVLRNMFESMLPSDDSGIYGGDSSAGIWRSLSADQMAGVYAERGGIGIAQSLLASPEKPTMMPQEQWPYFNTSRIRGFAG